MSKYSVDLGSVVATLASSVLLPLRTGSDSSHCFGSVRRFFVVLRYNFFSLRWRIFTQSPPPAWNSSGNKLL